MRLTLNLQGQIYGRLHVTSAAPRRSTRPNETRWFCRCRCGNEVNLATWQLRNGHTKSCGCLKKEIRQNFKTKGSLS